ncbi:unnamed protein product [Callosobruchus maculatus]|uniref:TTF-type domain-containing protein n=1 Tax=Callosobruchus maculatus TaxID=64391 RepID=A0A653D9W6_CALMS|nr:unnamed protein product [Callosobruchus maculatus]
MSAPRKKLSGAEYRKKARSKQLQGKQCADKMKNWLLRGGGPSVSAASEIDIQLDELEDVSRTLPDQMDQDFSPTVTKQSLSTDFIEQTSPPSLSMCEEQLGRTKPEYEESESSSHSDSDELQKNGLDFTDPGNWPGVEKMTDQQRSLFSNQAALLAENHPENIEFRSTERNGRHLTSSMWYRTLANCERVKRSWLIYSKTKNAIICACCKIYQKPSSAATSALCSTGFINWKKVSERLAEHEATQMHKECMIKWKTRLQQMKSCQGIDQDIERAIHTEKEKWRQILRIVMDAVLYLSTNCLSFRGSNETPSDLITQCPQPSQGNFLNLIALLAKHNSTLKFQLEHLKKGQVSYLSKTIQNEIIDIMAKTVRNSILNDIKEAKYYTIMFDCTPDVSHTEQMSQVIRYVKKTGNVCEIKESFIDFIEVAGKTGEIICQQILEKLTVDALDIDQCRGQSYDNGSNMAGIYKGAQARIAERNELAEFVPCLAHSLNLVGVHSASSCQEAINLFGLIQKVYTFFVGSSTRWDIMKKYVKTNLKGCSQTRWSAKHVAVNALLNNLPKVAEALEEVKQTSHAPEAKYEAGYLLNAIKNFNFILNLTIWANILREINRVNIEIQKEDIILARSVALMDGLLKTLQKMRENPMEYWIKEAAEVAAKTGVEPILQHKRIPKRKKQFDETCEDELQTLQPVQLFSKEIMMVFDRTISEIKKRFECASMLNSNFAFLNGYFILNMPIVELQKHGADLARKYERDLNSVEFCQELYVFKEQAPLLFGSIEKANGFYLLQQIYAHDLQDAFPNICIALRIYSTLPTTSASCERSFSKLKLIKYYLRSSMSQERLSSLAILAIENRTAHEINYEEAIDLFAEQKARRVKL